MAINVFSQFDNYPIRPDMLIGESLSGYIYRFLSLNGHTVSDDLMITIKCCFSDKVETAKESRRLIKSMLGDRLLFEPHEWRQPYGRNGSLYSIYYKNTSILRLCPYCLKNLNMHFYLWSFPLFVACPVHKTFLLNCCWNCNKPYQLHRLNPGWRCKCGVPITAVNKMQGKISPSSLVVLAKLVTGAKDMKLPINLKLVWSDTRSANSYDLERLYYLLGGPSRYILDNSESYLPIDFVRNTILH